MDYKIEATIPSGQYGNIRPTFTIESSDDERVAMETLASLWNRYGDKPMQDKAVGGVKITSFTDEEVIWNEDKHIYTDLSGKVLLSGSKYAAMNSPVFPKDMILPKTSAKWGVSEENIEDMWSRKGGASLDLGNAVHKALEMYHLHHVEGKKIMEVTESDENYALPKQPYLKRLVLDFVDKFGDTALSEVVVTDVANGMAGTIDRLFIVDEAKMVCRVQDYKSNTEIKKPKMLEYQKQLSFYAHILINNGWTVEGLDLFKLDADELWEKVEMEVLELE